MRIRKDIDFRWSVARASGSGIFRLRSVCVCAAAQFEASPKESGVTSVREQGPSSLWCSGAVAESIVVLWHCRVLLGLGRLCHQAMGNWRQVAKSDFFRTGKKNKGFGERSLLEEAHLTALLFARWEHAGEHFPVSDTADSDGRSSPSD